MVIHPFSSDKKKRIVAKLPEIRAELAAKGLNGIVVGDHSDKCAVPVTTMPLLTLAAVLKRSRGFIGTDSVVGHLAGWAGVPITTVCGRKNREWYAPIKSK